MSTFVSSLGNNNKVQSIITYDFVHLYEIRSESILNRNKKNILNKYQ